MTVTDPLIDPSPAPVVAPIAAAAPADPDADWETVRARVMARLAAEVGGAWSDHNAADPGVTLAESAAFGLADLHYRIAERPFDAWPLEVRAWEADAERHWHATLPALSSSPLPSPPPPASLTGLADALAAAATSARVLEPLVRGCESREAALALLASAPWSAALAPEHRPAVVSLMRSRWVRQVAQEQAHVVVAALAAEAAAPGAGPVDERDARAAGRLALTLPLWPDELTAVVRRERRRLAVAVLVDHLAQIRALTPQTPPVQVAALEADLAARDLDADEVAVALAAAEQPPGLLPEHLEDAGGRSRIWPPHPLQALTCEPVTELDYARRAREHPQVGRAWAVPGRLEGVAWNGLPTGAMAGIAVDPEAPALTLVVERTRGTSSRDRVPALGAAGRRRSRGRHGLPGLADRQRRARSPPPGLRRGRRGAARHRPGARPGHPGDAGRRGPRPGDRRRPRPDRGLLRGRPTRVARTRPHRCRRRTVAADRAADRRLDPR